MNSQQVIILFAAQSQGSVTCLHICEMILQNSGIRFHIFESHRRALESGFGFAKLTAELWNRVSHLRNTTAELWNRVSHLRNATAELWNPCSHLRRRPQSSVTGFHIFRGPPQSSATGFHICEPLFQSC